VLASADDGYRLTGRPQSLLVAPYFGQTFREIVQRRREVGDAGGFVVHELSVIGDTLRHGVQGHLVAADAPNMAA